MLQTLGCTVLFVTIGTVTTYLLIPHRALMHVNRVRKSIGLPRLKRLEKGLVGSECHCPLAESFGIFNRVHPDKICLESTGLASPAQLMGSWGHMLSSPTKYDGYVQYRHHLSTRWFVRLFDQGPFYRRYRLTTP